MVDTDSLGSLPQPRWCRNLPLPLLICLPHPQSALTDLGPFVQLETAASMVDLEAYVTSPRKPKCMEG